MAVEISSFQYQEYKDELDTLKASIPDLQQAKAEARALGDLSENSEYDSAKAELDKTNVRINELENKLAKAVVISADNSPRIGLGSFVEIKLPGDSNFETRVLRLDVEGYTRDADPKKRVLGVESALGREILNGVSGVYKIHTTHGTLEYHVRKLTLDEAYRLMGVSNA